MLYDEDIVAWARQQAQLLRTGRFAELDIEHIAEEIEDVGKSEQRELASRMAVLLAWPDENNSMPPPLIDPVFVPFC